MISLTMSTASVLAIYEAFNVNVEVSILKSSLTLRRHCIFKPRRKKTGLLLLICHANELGGY